MDFSKNKGYLAIEFKVVLKRKHASARFFESY